MNNSMKKILLIIVFISSLFIITGCGNKKTVDVEAFTKIAKDQGYKVVDVSKAFYNYNKYTLKANGQYMYLSRIDNTLLYCNVQTKYEKAAKKLIKKLGY